MDVIREQNLFTKFVAPAVFHINFQVFCGFFTKLCLIFMSINTIQVNTTKILSFSQSRTENISVVNLLIRNINKYIPPQCNLLQHILKNCKQRMFTNCRQLIIKAFCCQTMRFIIITLRSEEKQIDLKNVDAFEQKKSNATKGCIRSNFFLSRHQNLNFKFALLQFA